MRDLTWVLLIECCGAIACGLNINNVKRCMVDRLRLYVQLARLDKPIGILLLLWPTLWGLWWAAGGWPSFKLIVIFVLGTVLMRSAGCVINDYADRDFDRHVERTVNRPLTSG